MRAGFIRRATPCASVLGVLLAATGTQATPIGLQNGDFGTNGGAGQLTVNSTLSGWTGGGKEGNFGSATTPPVFVFNAGSTTQLSATGVTGDTFMGKVDFYSATAAPGGGVVIAADGDPAWGGSINQTVSGLTVGNPYTVSFNWAGAQQQGFSGATTEKWNVSFGAVTQSTATVSTPSQQFAGWQSASLTFTPTSTSQTLSFLAAGSPSGEPPWLLLNNVSLSAASVPEPVSLALVGLGAAALLRRSRRMI